MNVLPEKIDRTKSRGLGQMGMGGFSMPNRTSNMVVQQQQQPPQVVNNSQVHQYPPQLVNQLPPGARISGPPLSLEQVKALQRGENFQVTGQPYPGQNVPPVNVPISGSNIQNSTTTTTTTQQKVMYQGMPPPQSMVVHEQPRPV